MNILENMPATLEKIFKTIFVAFQIIPIDDITRSDLDFVLGKKINGNDSIFSNFNTWECLRFSIFIYNLISRSS